MPCQILHCWLCSLLVSSSFEFSVDCLARTISGLFYEIRLRKQSFDSCVGPHEEGSRHHTRAKLAKNMNEIYIRDLIKK